MSDTTSAASHTDGRGRGPGVRVVTRRSAVVRYRGRTIGLGVAWAGKRVTVTEPKPDHVVVHDDATGAVIRELDLGPVGTHHGTGRKTTALERKAGLRFAGSVGAVTYKRRNIALGVAWAGKRVVISEPEPDHVVVRDHATGAVIRELDLGPIRTNHGTGARRGTPLPAPHLGPRTLSACGVLAYRGRAIYLGKDWIGKLVTATELEPGHVVVRDHAAGAVIRELDLGPSGTHHGVGRKPSGFRRKAGPRVLNPSGDLSYANREIGFGKALAGKLVIVTEPKPDHVVITDHETGEVLRTVDLGPVGTRHGTGTRGGRLGKRKTGPRVLVVTRSGAAVTYIGRNIGLGVAWAGKRVIVNEPVPGRVVITDHAAGEVIRELDLGPVGTYHGTGGKPGGRRKAVRRSVR